MPLQEAVHLLVMEELADRSTESPAAEAKGRVSQEWIKLETLIPFLRVLISPSQQGQSPHLPTAQGMDENHQQVPLFTHGNCSSLEQQDQTRAHKSSDAVVFQNKLYVLNLQLHSMIKNQLDFFYFLILGPQLQVSDSQTYSFCSSPAFIHEQFMQLCFCASTGHQFREFLLFHT